MRTNSSSVAPTRRDEKTGLLHRLADRALIDCLVDLEEAAGLRPEAHPRLDSAADEDDLAGVGDRQRGDDEPRIDVSDVSAGRACQALAVLAEKCAEDERRTTV